MPGGRERLNYIETKKLRLAPLGSVSTLDTKRRTKKIYREGCA